MCKRLEDELLGRLGEHLNQDLLVREQAYRNALKRTVEVLKQTRKTFHSKQLKQLREELEEVLENHSNQLPG